MRCHTRRLRSRAATGHRTDLNTAPQTSIGGEHEARPDVIALRLRARRDPCGADRKGWPDPRASAYAAGSRASSHDDGCWAGRCACSQGLRSVRVRVCARSPIPEGITHRDERERTGEIHTRDGLRYGPSGRRVKRGLTHRRTPHSTQPRHSPRAMLFSTAEPVGNRQLGSTLIPYRARTEPVPRLGRDRGEMSLQPLRHNALSEVSDAPETTRRAPRRPRGNLWTTMDGHAQILLASPPPVRHHQRSPDTRFRHSDSAGGIAPPCVARTLVARALPRRRLLCTACG